MEPVTTFADGTSDPGGLLRPNAASAEWTAPAPLAVGGEVALGSSILPAVVLDELVREVPGVRGAILASVDGFGVAHSATLTDEASHPAMLAAAVGLAHQLVAIGDGTTLRQLVVDHDGGLLLVWPIGPRRVLAVLTASTVDQRALRMLVQSRAAELAGVAP